MISSNERLILSYNFTNMNRYLCKYVFVFDLLFSEQIFRTVNITRIMMKKRRPRPRCLQTDIAWDWRSGGNRLIAGCWKKTSVPAVNKYDWNKELPPIILTAYTPYTMIIMGEVLMNVLWISWKMIMFTSEGECICIYVSWVFFGIGQFHLHRRRRVVW